MCILRRAFRRRCGRPVPVLDIFFAFGIVSIWVLWFGPAKIIHDKRNMQDNNSHQGKGVLRDFLAEERTILANQRTFLAYLRTALAYFVAGASLIRFFNHQVFAVIGWVFIPASVLILVLGFFRHLHMKKIITATVSLPERDSDKSG